MGFPLLPHFVIKTTQGEDAEKSIYLLFRKPRLKYYSEEKFPVDTQSLSECGDIERRQVIKKYFTIIYSVKIRIVSLFTRVSTTLKP